jgi:lipoprotein-releasing system permease protein
LITIISTGGVALGVATVVIALSVMNGFENTIKEKMLSAEAHITVMSQSHGDFTDYDQVIKKVENVPRVVSASPVLIKQALIMDKSRQNQMGVIVKGIEVDQEHKVSGIGDYVIGDFDFEAPIVEQTRKALEGKDSVFGGIILGSGVARRLGVKRGKLVILVSNIKEDPIRLGGYIPIIKKFVVVGIYNSGMYDYDSALTFVSLQTGQKLYEAPSMANRVEVKIDDPYVADQVQSEMQLELGLEFLPLSWMETHGNLFSAIKLEKMMTFVIEILIVLVAAFSIASTLIMMVMEKTKDIGILKSIGATKSGIWAVFTMEGSIIGFVGAVLGTALGLAVCWMLKTWLRIPLPSDVYQINTLPVKISWYYVTLTNLITLTICWFATLYPSSQAARLNPVEALRYE